MSYSIRFAIAEDYKAICNYLETSWRPGHIFTKSKLLFDWQHWDAARSRYNMLLGCTPSGDIHGVLGFIPNGQFDPALKFETVFLCIWSVCEDARGHGLGSALLDFIEETLEPTFLATNGASEMSLGIYRKRGWETGKLEHWYILQDRSPAFLPEHWNDRRAVVNLPRKSAEYVKNRYLIHPFYRYWNEPLRGGCAVMRSCPLPEGDDMCIRIVDFVGKDSLFADVRWHDYLDAQTACWIDIYCTGISHELLSGCGFTRRIADEVIIPCHFEPYEFKNIDVNYAVKAPKGMPWRVVRGDGDGDRPNVLPC